MRTRKHKNKSIKNRVAKTIKNIKSSNKHDIKENLKLFLLPSNQYKSGRCWLFSFLNLLRISTIHKYQLKNDFMFSASYMMFWDKYEKANYFLTLISKYATHSLDDIHNYFVLNNMMSDGGTWNMLQNIINKYGVVPYEDMKETKNTINTSNINGLLRNKLKVFAKEIRASKHPKKLIDRQMKQIYKLLCNSISKPPKHIQSFNGKKIHKSPQDFYKNYIQSIKGNDVNKKILFLNAPHLKYNQYYLIKELNNMNNENDILYFNVNIKDLHTYIVNSLKDNVPVWFGSDYDKFNYKDESILNNQLFSNSDSKKKLYLNKENAIPFYQTNVNHAMLLTGFYYNKSKDKPNYWIIENSHDNKLKKISYENNKGNVIASNSWFKKYCILACVDEQYIHNKDIIEKIKDKKNIIELPKWSNLGELLVT